MSLTTKDNNQRTMNEAGIQSIHEIKDETDSRFQGKISMFPQHNRVQISSKSSFLVIVGGGYFIFSQSWQPIQH